MRSNAISSASAKTIRASVALAAALLALPPAGDAAPEQTRVIHEMPADWWRPAWSYRMRIRAPGRPHRGAGAAPTTALVQDLWLGGRCLPDGSDLRVVDEGGELVNFQILDLRPRRDSKLRIQVPANEMFTAWLYFGNSNAFPIVTERCDRFAPPWRPRGWLDLAFWAKPRREHPQTVADFRAMLAEAGKPQGVTQVDKVEYGYNLHGESDHYLSAYTGEIKIAEPGTYEFLAYADEGCWMLIDGKVLIEDPGPRPADFDIERSARRCKVELGAGYHEFEFLHEEGTGMQMTFLRWKPPGAPVPRALPRDIWGPLRGAFVDLVEARDRPLVASMRCLTRHSYWIPETQHQINWVAFDDTSSSRAGKIVSGRLELDDGVVYTQGVSRVEHIFFSNGRRPARLTVADEKGNTDSFDFDVLLWQHTTEIRFDFKAHWDPIASLLGRKARIPYHTYYMRLLNDSPPYPTAVMSIDDLVGYALFWEAFADDGKLLDALRELLARAPQRVTPQLSDYGFEAVVRSGVHADLAERFLEHASSLADGPVARARLLLRKAFLLTWHHGRTDDAIALLEKVRAEKQGRPDDLRDLRRRAWLAEADTWLVRGDTEKARAAVDRARELLPDPPSKAEQAAMNGSYPFAVEDYLARDMVTPALNKIGEWEARMPSAKLAGLSLFLRGKAMYQQRPSDMAARFLEVAEAVNPRGLYAPQAAWLRANCLLDLNRVRDAARAFARIRDDFTRAKYLRRVHHKLKECEERLAAGKTEN